MSRYLPHPRIVFRAGFYALLAALAGAAYWVFQAQALYVAVLLLGYMSAHTLIAKTIALWVDRLYYATLGRREGEEREARLARKRLRMPVSPASCRDNGWRLQEEDRPA